MWYLTILRIHCLRTSDHQIIANELSSHSFTHPPHLMPTWCKGRCIRCVSASRPNSFLYLKLPGFLAYLDYWKWASQMSTPDSGVWKTWLGRLYPVREKPQFKRKGEAAPSVLEGFLHLPGVQGFLWFPLSNYEGWQPRSRNSSELHADAQLQRPSGHLFMC